MIYILIYISIAWIFSSVMDGIDAEKGKESSEDRLRVFAVKFALSATWPMTVLVAILLLALKKSKQQ